MRRVRSGQRKRVKLLTLLLLVLGIFAGAHARASDRQGYVVRTTTADSSGDRIVRAGGVRLKVDRESRFNRYDVAIDWLTGRNDMEGRGALAVMRARKPARLTMVRENATRFLVPLGKAANPLALLANAGSSSDFETIPLNRSFGGYALDIGAIEPERRETGDGIVIAYRKPFEIAGPGNEVLRAEARGRSLTSTGFTRLHSLTASTVLTSDRCGEFRATLEIEGPGERPGAPAFDVPPRAASTGVACSREQRAGLLALVETINRSVASYSFGVGERDTNIAPLLIIGTVIFIDELSKVIVNSYGHVVEDRALIDYDGLISANLSTFSQLLFDDGSASFSEHLGNKAEDYASAFGLNPDAARGVGAGAELWAYGSWEIFKTALSPGSAAVGLSGKAARAWDALSGLAEGYGHGDVFGESYGIVKRGFGALSEAGGTLNALLNARDALIEQIAPPLPALTQGGAAQTSGMAGTLGPYQPAFADSGDTVDVIRGCAAGITVNAPCGSAPPAIRNVADFVSDPMDLYTGGQADYTVLGNPIFYSGHHNFPGVTEIRLSSGSASYSGRFVMEFGGIPHFSSDTPITINVDRTGVYELRMTPYPTAGGGPGGFAFLTNAVDPPPQPICFYTADCVMFIAPNGSDAVSRIRIISGQRVAPGLTRRR